MLDMLDFTDRLARLLKEADLYKYDDRKLKYEIKKIQLDYELQFSKLESEKQEEGVI